MYLPEKGEVKNSPYSTEMHILKVYMPKQVIMKSGFQCRQLYQIESYKEPFHDQWYRRKGRSEPYVVISIYQKTFIQTKAVLSILKEKLGVAGYNVHTALSGTTNSVFMTEFDFLFFGLSFYVGWKSLFTRLRNF